MAYVCVQVPRSARAISPMLRVHRVKCSIHRFHALQVGSQVFGRHHVLADALDVRVISLEPGVYSMRIDEGF